LKALVGAAPLFLRQARPRADLLAQFEWPGVDHARARARARRVGLVAVHHLNSAAV